MSFLLCLEAFLDIFGEARNDFFDLDMGRVETKVVIFFFSPFGGGDHFMDLFAIFIDVFNLADEFLVGEFFFFRSFEAAAFDFGFHARVDKDREWVLVGQDFGTSMAYDDAVAFFGEFLNDLLLRDKDVDLLLIVECMAELIGDKRDSSFGDFVDEVFIHACLFADFFDDFLVVIGEIQLFGQSFSDFSSSASKFSRDSDDFWH